MKVDVRTDLGAEMRGFRIQDVTAAKAQDILDLVYTHKLLVLMEQAFEEREYVEFARALGTPQVYLQKQYHHPDWPEIFVSSNVTRNGTKFGVKGTGRYWHTDYAFMPEPLPLTMVTPRLIPKASRGTLYIDMERVCQQLPRHLRAFAESHDAIHEGKWQYKIQANDVDRSLTDILAECERLAPASIHPAIIDHPARQRRCLYVSSGFTTGFRDVPYDEGKRWLAELTAFVEREEHVRSQPWAPGQVLLWDNRCLLHKAAHGNVDEPNLSFRIGVYDGLPFYRTRPVTAPEERHAIAG
jgi:taurine dioxygenase